MRKGGHEPSANTLTQQHPGVPAEQALRSAGMVCLSGVSTTKIESHVCRVHPGPWHAAWHTQALGASLQNACQRAALGL